MIEFNLTLTAIPENASPARSYLRDYIAVLGLDEMLTQDILGATGEAVANCVEHAYYGRDPGAFHIYSCLSAVGDTLVFQIKDDGHWRPDHPSEDRGRGYELMRALSSGITTERRDQGTIVTMVFSLGENDKKNVLKAVI
jgi:anti-sigma regulatory factor (Ser/Thr protein kinase)